MQQMVSDEGDDSCEPDAPGEHRDSRDAEPAEKYLLPNARTNNHDYPVPDRKSHHLFHARTESW